MTYPMAGFKPLVIESFRNITFDNILYTRRLRISGMNACILDEGLQSYIYQQRTRFVVLDTPDIIKACEILEIEYKEINTYFEIDLDMCSFKSVP